MDRLVPLVYEELARIAHRQLRLEVTGHTLSTTALVHEAFLRLVDQTRAQWADRAQFFGVASHAMRRVLVDHAGGTVRRAGAGCTAGTSRSRRSRRPTRRASPPVSAPTFSWRSTRRSSGSPPSMRGRHAWWSVASSVV